MKSYQTRGMEMKLKKKTRLCGRVSEMAQLVKVLAPLPDRVQSLKC